jgi:alanyl-tRNA synthetase
MGEAYPDLSLKFPLISQVMTMEEVNFGKTLANGLELLGNSLNSMRTDNKQIPSDLVYQLHKTHGFYSDLTSTLASQHGWRVSSTEGAINSYLPR